ncbi:gamma-glutamyltransferase [Paenibacillus radicis (ex Xue et al. 2023)]|uniref:Glutathione hydrolase proenzyme n=1 Tax=Paenibacillus radicis (ex Xue et al. 2023) TaxID=2972489 RepID=A0ABT1YJE1_9BACL|nr:gamma-glutamyltransferase [Paenibacillus radicis (ex Xue et al. 2023)]MCR8633317.1 gamma-glutamyltransferase [Paenibacillus radicis (ex Xue et al. 2023)]
MNNIMPVAYRGMVASPQHLASVVGCSILQQGGNAFDASVAVSATLAVVYPHMTGLGGDAFFLIYDAKSGEVKGFNGSGRSGSQISPGFYLDKGLKAIPQRGVLSSITVPGMVDAWWEVWSEYGKLAWEKLLEPAIAYAEKGVPVSRDLHRWIVKDKEILITQESMRSTFMPNGVPLQIGEKLLQPELADTLKMISDGGREVFYKGKLMQRIVDAMRKDGGILIEDDFRSHRGEWVKPVSSTYRGSTIVQMPPNSQGFSALMMLNMLEQTELSEIPRHSAEFYHLLTEVVKKAFSDRDAYLTDPDFNEIPLDRLLSKEYARTLYRKIQLSPPEGEAFLSKAMGQDTAYAAAVDDEGNAVSFIQSLYYDFGSAYTAGDTGVIMQNRGSFFSLDSSDVNALAPGKRTFHTLMPGMVLREGKPFLLMGTQGGEGQPQTQLSLITGVLDYNCSIQEAIALPRWVYGRTWGVDSDTLKMENRKLDSTINQLRAWGHRVEVLETWDPATGQAQGIMIHPDGQLSGAADPRGDGLAIGW